MKSSKEDLRNRGFVEDEEIEEYKEKTKTSLISLLHDQEPFKRTIGARLLAKYSDKQIIESLIHQLSLENKLYPKIEITETLAKIGKPSISHLIPLLGTIGKNQYKSIPKKPFKKSNYPLPRDIIARTLIKIGETTLPYLEECCLKRNRNQILEAIDAIGYISFYSENHRALPILWQILANYPHDALLKWKIIRAFESFPLSKVIEFLKKELKHTQDIILKDEIKRSLRQIEEKTKIRRTQ